MNGEDLSSSKQTESTLKSFKIRSYSNTDQQSKIKKFYFRRKDDELKDCNFQSQNNSSPKYLHPNYNQISQSRQKEQYQKMYGKLKRQSKQQQDQQNQNLSEILKGEINKQCDFLQNDSSQTFNFSQMSTTQKQGFNVDKKVYELNVNDQSVSAQNLVSNTSLGSSTNKKKSTGLANLLKNYSEQKDLDFQDDPEKQKEQIDLKGQEILEVQRIIQFKTEDKYKQILHQINKNKKRKLFYIPKNDKNFINFKRYDLEEAFQNQSKSKRQFIENYQNIVKNEDNDIIDNPDLCENVLFTQISLSAMAHHKWKSVPSKNRLIKAKSMCPELSHYPLSPETQRQIELTKKKVHDFSRNQNNRKNEIKEKLILEAENDINDYLKSLIEFEHQETLVHQSKVQDFAQMMRFGLKTRNGQKLDAEEIIKNVENIRFKMSQFQKEYEKKMDEKAEQESENKIIEQKKKEIVRQGKLAPYYFDKIRNKPKPEWKKQIKIQQQKLSQSQNFKTLNSQKKDSYYDDQFNQEFGYFDEKQFFTVPHKDVSNSGIIYKTRIKDLF